jgi:threonylcarbamoyladenosine tRNA methylthiotransferase MtaB
MDRLSLESHPQKAERYTFAVHTYGCKVNTYDSGLLQQRLTRAGFENETGTTPRVHILNTCAVTAEATKQAVKDARRIRSREPLATIVLTGCAAQVDGATLDHVPGVDLVVANSHKGELERILDQFFKGEIKERVFRSNIFKKDDLEAGGGIENDHTRTFLKIQDGCNSFCSYCVIPYARGKSRSIPMNELVKRIHELQDQGASEVVLTGVHIADYEDETQPQGKQHLASLIETVLEKTKIPRIRLSSLEPGELTPEIMDFYKNDRLCAHFHMSIQSANTSVLNGMKRRYTQGDVVTSLNMIHDRLPHAFVGMDVITGFPGETDEAFEDTSNCLEALPWTRIHVFPYSERPGTKAAALMQDLSVPKAIRAARAARLRELSSERFARAGLAQIGTLKDVLVLKSGVAGLSRDYWPVQLQSSSQDLRGREVKVEITGYDHSDASRMDGVLVGKLVGDLN